MWAARRAPAVAQEAGPQGMNWGRRCLLALGVCLALLIGAGAASARLSNPIATIAATNGGFPQIALGDDGHAQIAYVTGAGVTNSVHACQLSPGAVSCAHKSTIGHGYTPAAMVPDLSSSSNVDVVFNGQGPQYPDPDGDEAVAASTDGGASYGAPVLAGHGLIEPELIVPGPGAFSFSGLSFSDFLSGPLDGSTTPGGASLAPDGASDLEVPMGIGFPDPTTPLPVWYHVGANFKAIGYRRWRDTGSVNNPSTWGRFKNFIPPDGMFTAGTGDVASGPKGVFALYYPKRAGGSKCGQVPEIVRYQPTTDTWAAPLPVDANLHKDLSSCSYGDGLSTSSMQIAEDSLGVLHVVYSFDSGHPSGDDSPPQGLLYTVSFDGGRTFQPPVSVASPNVSYTTLHLAVNDSGEAAMSFVDSGGAVKAEFLPPLSHFGGGGGGGGGGGCQSTIVAGRIKALATQGCWKKSGSTYTEAGPIKLDGIDIIPAVGGAGAAAAPTISIDTVTHAITSDASWDLKVGSVDLGAEAVNWVVDGQDGKLLDAASNDPVMFAVSKGQELLGLPVLGTVTPSLLTGGLAKLPVNVQLPDPLSGIAGDGLTDDLNLTADVTQGLHLSLGSIKIQLPEVDLGPAKIDPFSITYNADPFTFQGDLGVQLPGGAGLDGHLLIRNGDLVDLSAAFRPFDPGIPVATGVFLTKVGFHLHKGETCARADQTNFGLDASIAGGPSVAGTSLIGIDGSANFYLPKGSCNLPARFRIDGTGRIVGLAVAHVYFEFATPPAELTFGAAIDLGSPKTAEISASIDGGIDPSHGAFFIEGKANVTVLKYELAEVDVIGSNIGLGACAKLTPIPPLPVKINAGAAYTWSDGHLAVMPDDCNVSFLRPQEFAASDAAASRTIQVPRGEKAETFLAYGAHHAPAITLSGPGGISINSPSPSKEVVKTSRYTALTLDGIHEAAITVRHPPPGTWTITPRGSEPVSELRAATEMTMPTAQASVHRLRGGRLRLQYRVRGGSPGLTIQAVQRAHNGGSAVIGQLHRGTGSITFRPAPGPAGRRNVLLIAHASNGVATSAPVLAHFKAPPLRRPASPRHVHLTRAGGGVRVTWSAASGARRYVVRATLYDGRRQEYPLPRSRRSLKLSNVPAADYGRIFVYAVATDGRLSAPAGARLKAEPVAAFRFSPSHPRRGHRVRFNASASRESGGRIVRYRWSFGDHSKKTSGRTVRHVFKHAGRYTVTLTVTDARGRTDSTKKRVSVGRSSKGRRSRLGVHARLEARLFTAGICVGPSYWRVAGLRSLTGRALLPLRAGVSAVRPVTRRSRRDPLSAGILSRCPLSP
jgi:hypothetical protein